MSLTPLTVDKTISPFQANFVNPASASPNSHDSESSATVDKTKAVSRSIFIDIAKGIFKSRILRALLFSAVAVGTFLLLASNPVGWMIALVCVLAFAAALMLTSQKSSFEFTALLRLGNGLFGKPNYHCIFQKGEHGGKIFLGSLPNRLAGDGERLATKEGVKAVLSMNEANGSKKDPNWELDPIGFSAPYSKDDWDKLKVENKQIFARDHKPLNSLQLNAAADWIKKQIDDGKNVLVHCRGGVGRSAMAVAAYLIKYEGKSAKEAKDLILSQRPISTIGTKNKMFALKLFESQFRAVSLEYLYREAPKKVEDCNRAMARFYSLPSLKNSSFPD